MNHRAGLFGAVLILGAVLGPPSFAARPIQGAAGEVTVPDAAALGAVVGWRIWSALPGGTTAINNNTASCRNVRCIRSFVTNTALAAPGATGGGGFVSNQEATQVYNDDQQDQPFYLLADASMNDATGSHIGFFGVSGVTANNAGVGQFLTQVCSGANAQNCFGRIDRSSAGPPLTNTTVSYGGTRDVIVPIGGLNPIPNVRVTPLQGCDFSLTWNDPPTYEGTMRPSTTAPAPPSPVLGVALYRIDLPPFTCDMPAGNNPGWTKMGNFALGAGTVGTLDHVPCGAPCRRYALAVRLIGPGGLPNEVETYHVGVRISGVTATYAGHGVVLVRWTSGLEGDTLGYHVTRSPAPNGPYSRISGLIVGKGDASVYSFTDSIPASTDRTYYYRIELVARDGTVSSSSTTPVSLPGRTMKTGPRIR